MCNYLKKFAHISMSANSGKSREEILAARQAKKNKKAALKSQPKEKDQNAKKEVGDSKLEKKKESGASVVSSNEVIQSSKSKTDVLNESKTVLEKKHCTVTPKTQQEDKIENSKLDTPANKNEVEKNKSSGAEDIGNVKSKAQLKAERRAKQEAERARKLEKTQAHTPVEEVKKIKQPVKTEEPVKAAAVNKTVSVVSHKVKLFAHLYDVGSETDSVDGSQDKIHPSIIELGAQYSSKVVSGANACCLALLNAFKKVVMDFETPPNQEFSRGLEAEITKSMAYLSKCRPLAVSMVNAVKHLKFQVTQSKGNELECKNIISEWIDVYIKEQLEMAAKAICLFVREKIAPGDVILTYGCSSLIQQILISVHNEGIHFQVVVVDGRPWLEGKEMLKRLVRAGIQCTYVFVSGLSFIMPEVTKILLGAHALLANGYVMSRAGSSQIALLAKTYNVPVLVCCETHKFSERVQTDAFVYNELGSPDDLASKKGCLSQELSKWKSIPFLTPLNLTYDVTPPDLVSAVVTEIAVLPCTSVPVILRIKPPDISG